MHNGYFIYFYHSGSQKIYILTKDCSSSSFGVDITFSPMIQQWTFNCHSPILSQKRIPYYKRFVIFMWYCLHGILTCQSCYSLMFFFVSLNVVYLLYMDVSGFFFMLHAKPKLFFFLDLWIPFFLIGYIGNYIDIVMYVIQH